MMIAAMGDSTSESIAWGNANCANDAALKQSGLLAGLSNNELASAVNFDLTSEPESQETEPEVKGETLAQKKSSGGLYFPMLSLLGLLALRQVRVSRKN